MTITSIVDPQFVVATLLEGMRDINAAGHDMSILEDHAAAINMLDRGLAVIGSVIMSMLWLDAPGNWRDAVADVIFDHDRDTYQRAADLFELCKGLDVKQPGATA